jgi:hypothetical protein
MRVEIHGPEILFRWIVAASVPLYADFTYTATTRDYGRLDARLMKMAGATRSWRVT